MVNPIRELSRGSRFYWLGVKWLRRHPIWFFVLFIPTVLGLALMIGALLVFWNYQTDIMRSLLFQPGDGWLWVLPYYLGKAFLYVATLGLSMILGLLTANILSAPVYEFLSCAVEKDKTGKLVEISFSRSLLSSFEELKKVLLIALLSILVFIIPGFNLLGILVTAGLLAWNYYDYPLARRGWTLKQRLNLVRQDFWAILGMGLWLIIPFAHFILMPLAVVGGTLLSLERIEIIERRGHGS
ncbi:MAG: EI24 domain-containing protein [Proteobacteria bacterium]|nr:EI24 domain-containing protein [Pseudomonadota bacterium]